jgi:hypothetical protein
MATSQEVEPYVKEFSPIQPLLLYNVLASAVLKLSSLQSQWTHHKRTQPSYTRFSEEEVAPKDVDPEV